jgi:photosystem II stability/assembly factor-like uncharacterized protein
MAEIAKFLCGLRLYRSKTLACCGPISIIALMKNTKTVLLVSTRKGAFLYQGDRARKTWKLDGPHFLGQVVNHLLLDPRDGKTLVMAAKAGHLGPTVFRSVDGGKSWKEASKPPAFSKESGRAVKHVFWLTPGHRSRPGSWYAGVAPHGMFRSDDGGDTWQGVAGLNDHPDRKKWFGESEQGPPDDPNTHSILVDPRDENHLYVGFSAGGIFESSDGGREWKPLNKGVAADFIPVKDPEYGHDPHCIRMHPQRPDRLYHQNHCGIYRIDRPGDTWTRIGKNMPKEIGDIGFPMVLHPRDPDTAWVFPMDGTQAWPRTSPGGRPAVYATRNGGTTWKRLDKGFPRAQAWWTVKRQCFAADGGDPVGLYLGTSQGELWMSRNEGAKWELLARNLPPVTAVETGTRG